jgi:hypothetical protein
MSTCSFRVWLTVGVITAGLCPGRPLAGQEPAARVLSVEPVPQPGSRSRGVEVQTRGAVHEAFARPTGEPQPGPLVPKRPPEPLQELPPDQKPAGNAVWIGGYWSWDEQRQDFLWVSGIWRVPPPGKSWVPGYWRMDNSQWQWVAGFWTTSTTDPDAAGQDVNYLPAPPATPLAAPPGAPPSASSFYVPGNWVWDGERYTWRAGYWARVEPGYVWVQSHYCWTPGGCVFVPGYWDWTIPDRGILYAPVYVPPAVLGPGFVYTPSYVVCDPIFFDSLFVGPGCGYFFGNYYDPFWCGRGYVPWAIWGGRNYDPLYAHALWEHRRDPHWREAQLALNRERAAGRAPVPPRTLAEQRALVRRNAPAAPTAANVTANRVVAPAWRLAVARGITLKPLDLAQRYEARDQADALRQAGVGRREAEVFGPGGPDGPHVGQLDVPRLQSVERSGEASWAGGRTGRGPVRPSYLGRPYGGPGGRSSYRGAYGAPGAHSGWGQGSMAGGEYYPEVGFGSHGPGSRALYRPSARPYDRR